MSMRQRWWGLLIGVLELSSYRHDDDDVLECSMCLYWYEVKAERRKGPVSRVAWGIRCLSRPEKKINE